MLTELLLTLYVTLMVAATMVFFVMPLLMLPRPFPEATLTPRALLNSSLHLPVQSSCDNLGRCAA